MMSQASLFTYLLSERDVSEGECSGGDVRITIQDDSRSTAHSTAGEIFCYGQMYGPPAYNGLFTRQEHLKMKSSQRIVIRP